MCIRDRYSARPHFWCGKGLIVFYSNKPVSYTHLDVYKRQILESFSLPNNLISLITMLRLSLEGEGKLGEELQREQIDPRTTLAISRRLRAARRTGLNLLWRDICLLYTSDCLFIDEGFSALDQEHLELVADAILRLSQDGRMVGIVTHDPSFAHYFPLHLEVRGGKAFWKRNEEVI